MVNVIGGTQLCKVIRVHHHYLRDIINHAKLEHVYVPTTLQNVHILTKPLRRIAVIHACQKIRMAHGKVTSAPVHTTAPIGQLRKEGFVAY